jgi:hypothetical protein
MVRIHHQTGDGEILLPGFLKLFQESRI